MTSYHADITELLRDSASEWMERSALYGMSTAGLLCSAAEEIDRLRRELAAEMKKSGNSMNQPIKKPAEERS
tara:strand:- start:748 stop:963 length:216 start_codon:yes stop_codon:yes gene_type:complete